MDINRIAKWIEKNSQISHAKHFKLIYVDTLPSKRWSINPHFLSMGVIVTPFPEYGMEKGKILTS